MLNTSLQIANLMSNNNLSAAEMTHALKILGNGNMQNGFNRIGCYFSKEIMEASAKGLTTGRIQGFVLGVSSTIIIGGVSTYIINKIQKEKELEKEGQEIHNAMQQNSLPYEKENNLTNQESERSKTYE